MMMKRITPICIAGILLATAFGAAALSTQKNTQDDPNKDAPLVFVLGTLGNNDWYISEVRVSYQYNPSDVAEIWYRLKGTWIKYTAEFTVSDDGSYIIPWYWINKNGSKTNGFPIEFKIDQTKPTIQLSRRKIGEEKVNFTATASDATSGIEKVEFFVDNRSQANDTTAPYSWIRNGGGVHEVKAIAYDKAGHYKESNIITTHVSYAYTPPLFRLIRLLLQTLFHFDST